MARWSLETTDGRVILELAEPEPGQPVRVVMAAFVPSPPLDGSPLPPNRWPTLEELTAWLADTQEPATMLALPTLRAERVPDPVPGTELVPEPARALLALLIPPEGGIAALPHLPSGMYGGPRVGPLQGGRPWTRKS